MGVWKRTSPAIPPPPLLPWPQKWKQRRPRLQDLPSSFCLPTSFMVRPDPSEDVQTPALIVCWTRACRQPTDLSRAAASEVRPLAGTRSGDGSTRCRGHVGSRHIVALAGRIRIPIRCASSSGTAAYISHMTRASDRHRGSRSVHEAPNGVSPGTGPGEEPSRASATRTTNFSRTLE